MAKRQFTLQINEEDYKKMKEVRDEAGMPISRQADLKLRGYKIVKDE